MTGTEILYFPSADACYLKEFDASISESGPDHVILDKTLFYAEAGGQPTDTGVLRWDRGEARVWKVTKEKGVIRHFVDRLPPSGPVHGVLDWDRRYAHMRMHTSQHVLSGLVFKIYGARTVGNQIHADHSRVDFQPATFTADDLKRIEEECNKVFAAARPVDIFEEDRVVVENRVDDRALMNLIPRSIRRLRIVRIQDIDYCPCGGTHLKTTGEVGTIDLKRKNVGKGKERIEIYLDC